MRGALNGAEAVWGVYDTVVYFSLSWEQTRGISSPRILTRILLGAKTPEFPQAVHTWVLSHCNRVWANNALLFLLRVLKEAGKYT